MVPTMKLWPLILAGLFAAVAFDLAAALITHRGVGPLEYVVGVVLIGAFGALALRSARRSVTKA